MRVTADQIHSLIVEFDTLDADQAKFMEEAAGGGGAAWAIERYGEQMFFARQCARIVRPLLNAYGKIKSDEDRAEWLDMVKDVKRECTDRLIRLHGRHNSTGNLQNVVNQCEAEAMSRIVSRLDYVRWE